MATKNKNKNRNVEGRPLRDVLPDDLHLDFFSDTIIEKNDINDTMALMKNVSKFNIELDKVPSWWNIPSIFTFFSKKASEPSPALLKIEAAKTTGELLDVFDNISNRKYSNVQLLTHVQMAQLTQMFSRFRHIQEGLTIERNMITFEKRNVPNEKKLKYSHHAYQDTYDEILQYSTTMQEKKYSKPSLSGVATDVYLQISGVFKGFYFLAADSTSRSFWVPMLVTSVLVPYGFVAAGFTTGAIVGINFIFNLSPAYVKYLDRRKYEEDTGTVMGICKVIAEASKQTFFVSALQYLPGLIFAEGYVTCGSIVLPVIGRLVMNDEYKQANIKAAMESNKGTEEMKLRQETLGKSPDLQNFFHRYDKKAVGNFSRILATLEYGVNFSKNVFFSLPVLGHIVLYQNFAVYTLTVDVVNLVWNHSFDPISWFLHWAENLYDDKKPTGNDSRNSTVDGDAASRQSLSESNVKKICGYCGIAFKTAVSVGKKIYDTIKAITTTAASGAGGIVKAVALPLVSLSVLALLGIFFSDALNTIPPKTLASCLGVLPTWMGYLISNIKDSTCWVVVLIMRACGIHEATKNVWDGVKQYVLCYAEHIYVYLFKNFTEKAQTFDAYCLGGFVSNLLADISKKFPSLVINSVEKAIEVFQNGRNVIFAQTELGLVKLMGNPNTVKLATRITNLGLSMGFFSAMIVGLTKAPEFLYRTYEKIVLTNIRVIGISVAVVGATASILAATGAVTLAGINPLAILALAIGFIQNNYVSLVPGATAEIAELCKNYIFRIVSSENFFTFINNSANSQATTFVMMAIRPNLTKYIAVYLPFIGSILWQDFTGTRLAVWKTLAFSLATGITTYTGLHILGSTRLGLKLKQCVDTIQSISFASVFQETNFLFKWYIADTDILETAFSDMFKYLFVEVYTRQKIDLLVKKFSSEYVFAKPEVQEKLSDEEIAAIVEEDYKSTADIVKNLQSEVADIEKTRLLQMSNLRDIIKKFPARGDPEIRIWSSVMKAVHPLYTPLEKHINLEPLYKINPEWMVENCDPSVHDIDESESVMDVLFSKINIANESHFKFRELVQRNVVDKLTVYANGLCNEMAFWRTTSPDINTRRVEVAERYAHRIREKYELMGNAMGPLFSQVEDVLDLTNELSDDVRQIIKSETDGGVSTLSKTGELAKIGFVERNIKIEQLTNQLKKSITINEPLNILDRKLTLLQNQVKDILIADASETSTFDELSKTKKILEDCSDFSGSLVEKMKLVLDVCKQDMEITRQNVLSIAHVSFDANGIMEKDNFYRDVVAPLKKAEILVVEDLILESAAGLDRADKYIANALDIISNEDREFRINRDVERDDEFENAQDYSLSAVFNRLYKLMKVPESDYRLIGFNDEKDVKLFNENVQDRKSDGFIGDVIAPTQRGKTIVGKEVSFKTPDFAQQQRDDKFNRDVIAPTNQGQTVTGYLTSFQTRNMLQSKLDRMSDKFIGDVVSPTELRQSIEGKTSSFKTTAGQFNNLKGIEKIDVVSIISPGMMHGTKVSGKLENDVITPQQNYKPGGIYSYIQSTPKLQTSPDQLRDKPRPISPALQLDSEKKSTMAPVQNDDGFIFQRQNYRNNDKFRRDVIAPTERPQTFSGENLSFITAEIRAGNRLEEPGKYISYKEPVVGQQRGTRTDGNMGENGNPEIPNWKDRVTEDYFRLVVDETKKNYDGLNVETRNFLREIGYSTDAEMRAVVKDFGNVINLDERKALSILDFTIEQKKKLREWEQNILKTAKMGINIASKKKNPRILQPDVDSLVNLKNTMDAPQTPKKGILIPVLEKKRTTMPPGFSSTSIEPEKPLESTSTGIQFKSPSENRLIALAREATKKFSINSRNQKIEISSAGIDTGIKSQTKIDITIETKIESTTDRTIDTKTSTAFGTPDDSPNVKEGRESVFRRKDTGIKQKPEGAPEPLKEGLLSFNDKNGLFLKSRASNWFRQKNTILSELIKKGDKGIQSISAFKKIYEKWNDVITSIAGQNDIILDNIGYVKKNYTLMSYSEEFSRELEKIEVTPEILSTVFPRNEQRENIRQALDEITLKTGKPATFANPLFLWALSEKRAPPHILNEDDPLENVRNQLLVRSEVIIAEKTADLRKKLEEQYSVFDKNMDNILNTAPRLRTVTLKLYPYRGIMDNLVNQAHNAVSWVKSKISDIENYTDEIGNMIYSATKPARDVLFTRLSHGTEPSSTDILNIFNRREKLTRLQSEDLHSKFLLMPKDVQTGSILKDEFEKCRQSTFVLEELTERIRSVEYRIPYEAITGNGLVGVIATKIDYQDIDNRYLPKERWVMLDNYQYNPTVMDALFITGGNLKINPEYERDLLALSTSFLVETLHKQKVDPQYT
jgi:hypothetical protein